MPLYIGLMSGTSVDAVDATLVEIHGRAIHLHTACARPIPAELRATVLGLRSQGAGVLDTLLDLDVTLARLFAAAAQDLLTTAGVTPAAVHAIGSHGQTLYHRPTGVYPTTLQVGDPNIIAEITGITTVADFRRRDMAVGGQGAPLVPAFHHAVFHDPHEDRVVLNLGGIANITLLPMTGAVRGFDTGPGNGLMDAWIQRHQGKACDMDGTWAASGEVDVSLLATLCADPYLALPPPKSTGREHYHLDWLDALLASGGTLPLPGNVQATLCEFTAVTVARAIVQHLGAVTRVLVCGGGAHNPVLMARLRAHLAPRQVVTTAEYGLAPDWVEAAAFAWLAHQTLAGQAGNLPTVTGAHRAVVLGGVYPSP